MNLTRNKVIIWLAIITAVIIFFSVYFLLVPFNIFNVGFRILIVLLLLLWSIPLFLRKHIFENPKPFKKSLWQIPLYIAIFFTAVNLGASIVTSALFMSENYRTLISVVDTHTFTDDVENYTTMQIPVVDKGLAEKLGDKKLGEDNLGSQYNVGEYYMICHENNLYWIAPQVELAKILVEKGSLLAIWERKNGFPERNLIEPAVH